MGLLMKLSRIAPHLRRASDSMPYAARKTRRAHSWRHFENVYLCKQEVKYFDNAFSQNRNGRMTMSV